ncbi:MAG: hypothetical protein WC503_06170 [Candidatus Shapirobacteria bacterium]
MKKIFIILALLTTIVTRFYNLDTTARFIWDESMDLVNTSTLFHHFKITLIGPISEGGGKVFSAITYYLFLPFAALFRFDPVSTAYSTAFFGIITVVIFWMFLYQQKKLTKLTLLLPILLSPLLVSSRWAWNPHFIPLWQILGFLILFSKVPYKYTLSGIVFGLTIHQHWYAFFACLGISFIVYKVSLKKIPDTLKYFFGLFLAILPFILFDITHPPGLFISRMIYFSPVSPINGAFNFSTLIHNLSILPINFLSNFIGNSNLILIGLFITPLLISLFKKQSRHNYFLIPIVFQIIGLSLISGDSYSHYYLPAVIPFLLWISLNISQKSFQLSSLLLLILFAFNIPKIFINYDWTNNIQSTRQVVNIIQQDQSKLPQKFNVATLGSPDINTKARRYRDLLSLKNINPESPDDYQNISTLYVISYQSDWTKLSKDPAYELDNFRKIIPSEITKISNSDWYLYKISRTKN